MNILLCGYNWAGCRALDHLLEMNCTVFVCTHKGPDHIPSLYDYCIEKGVPVSLDSVNEVQLPFNPDYLCSIYYRNFIHTSVLENVDYKAMNLHPSLLPKYRGCSSLTWAMINDEPEVGYTYHYIDNSFDTGKIILQKRVPTFKFEYQTNLYQRVMFEAMLSFKCAFGLLHTEYAGESQIGEPSYFSRGAPECGEIKEHWPDSKIKSFIKAMINPPLPYATFRGYEIKNFNDYLRVKNENWD